MYLRRYWGEIRYLHDRRGETGRERFDVTVSSQGRTVRALSELDEEELLRDVVYAVDEAWRPLDAYVRLTIRDRFQGVAWFRFRDDGVECERFSARDGRASQFAPLPQRATLFAPHPLITDGWQARAYDFSRGPGRQRIEYCTNTSSTPDGSGGPAIDRVYKDLEYVDRATVRTPAGSFPCRHMKIHPIMGAMADWPALELWVTEIDWQLVRMRWDLLESTYVLTQFDAK